MSYCNQTVGQISLLNTLESPIIFKGNDSAAYRDPPILKYNDLFYLFFTLVRTEDGKIYSYTAESHSLDLKNWSPVNILTPKDQSLDFSSPGNIIKYQNEFSLTSASYYTEIWMIYGMIYRTGLGLSIGVAINPVLGTSIGLSIGTGVGMVLGMMYGARKDAEAKRRGLVI